LIDEFRLFVHPIIVGEGVPLFLHRSERTNLMFDGIQPFPSGLVKLQYRLAQGGPTP
jgi:dihydrofolate reductase